jgi:signal transduction histidine kinase
VARSFLKRLRALSETASRIAGGGQPGRVPPGGADELGRFAAAFNRMVDALAESRDRLVDTERMAALGKLASALAHEIRNPLSSIRMTAEILRPSVTDDEGREGLDVLLRELERLELFLEEILSLSGKIVLKPVETDMAGLAEETLALLKNRLSHLRIGTVMEIEPGLVFEMDPARMRQVLVNLVLNAAQAAGPGGTVKVRAGRDEAGALRIAVLDSGPGVTEEDRPKLFEPFFTTKPGGTGLGLAVSRRIAEAHGGRIEVGREEGWTRFAVVL